MTLVIDTSVIVKWFVMEDGHREATLLLENSDSLVCPDIAIAEAANVMWRKVRNNEISLDQARVAVENMPNFFTEVIPGAVLVGDAFALAQSLSHSVYDCFFLAAACMDPGSFLITDDRKFVAKCVRGGFADKIRPLKQEALPLELHDQEITALLELLNKHKLIEKNVLARIFGPPKTDQLRAFSMTDLKPVHDSPIYRKLLNKISKLDENQACLIMAICWYGRWTHGLKFESHLENARSNYLTLDKDAPYIIGLLHSYDNGLRKLKKSHPHFFSN